MKATKKTPALVRVVRELLKRRFSWAEIGRVIGVAGTTARAWVDDDYAAMRRGDGRMK